MADDGDLAVRRGGWRKLGQMRTALVVCGGSAIAWPSYTPLPGREGMGVGAAEALGGGRQNMLGRTVGIGEHV